MSQTVAARLGSAIMARMTRWGLCLALVTVVACHGDDDHHHGGAGACGQIVAACHDIDPGTGPISECHALGHDEVESDCEPQLTACLAVCVADAGVPPDAHEHDASHAHDDGGHAHHEDGGHAHGDGVCAELASLCHDAEGTLADECHDLGHDGDEVMCEAREVECRAACEHAGHDH